ncbi:MAG TPA: HD domain-containing phosphohydrolase [Dongiaceae bacterium]|nr:HD domain-containing phosphohydrolase [Dongiaceae bacterium]
MIARLQASRLRAPLHVHVATLFVVLVLAIGGLLATTQYRGASSIIVDSSDQLIHQIARQIQADLKYRQNAVVATLDLARLSGIVQAHDWQSRAAYLPWLQQVLRNHKGLTNFIIGYPDGDVVLLHSASTALQRNIYQVPEGTYMAIDHIDRDGDKIIHARRLSYDVNLQLLQEQPLPDATFDPRQRPWYRQAIASQQMEFTPPYPFFSSPTVGVTMARANPDGVVVAADLTLQTLSDILRSFDLPPRSEILLFDNVGQVLGYPDRRQMRAKVEGGDHRVPRVQELQSPLVQAAVPDLLRREGTWFFSADNESWFGAVEDVTVLQSLPVRLGVLIPEKELLRDALLQREQSIQVTLVILLLAVPLAWVLSRLVSKPLRLLVHDTNAVREFRFDQVTPTRSLVLEIDDLGESIHLMNETIQHFLDLAVALAREKKLDSLVAAVAEQTRGTAGAEASVLFLFSEDRTALIPRSVSTSRIVRSLEDGEVAGLDPDEPQLQSALREQRTGQSSLQMDTPLGPLLCELLLLPVESHGELVSVPLINREGRVLGVLCLLYPALTSAAAESEIQARLGFIHTLSGFAAVSVETSQLISLQKRLFTAFMELIASAIDAKSPYTGGHCQRVPVLTEMLARAACDSKQAPFERFDLNADEWEALHMASWLHDCGKVTTPEHVVDKATKLEARYDRIHEIRTRFEVAKANAETDYWRQRALGQNPDEQQLQQQLRALDEEFAFVAHCNQGGEFLPPQELGRLQLIAQRQWRRTLSDRLGIGWEEAQRKAQLPEPSLPILEPLLADRPDHCIPRDSLDDQRSAQQASFNLVPPQYKYNLGELHNLGVSRGTLTDEERYLINDHIVQTILMLEHLPYPEHLRSVPDIAGGHHEKMDGTGYPRGLTAAQMPLTARMMAIADIFEALTAGDRPYKAAKTLSESLGIMKRMVTGQHIDPDLFRLFIQSGVYREYAERFLRPEQNDSVDEAALLG